MFVAMSNNTARQDDQASAQVQPGHLDDRLTELQGKLRKAETDRTAAQVSYTVMYC